MAVEVEDGYIRFASFADGYQRARAWCYQNGYLPGLVINASEEAFKLKVKLSKRDAGAMFLQVLQRCTFDVPRCSGRGSVHAFRRGDFLCVCPTNNVGT
jgi:hypothetical protein